jgi:hypothetical protein
MKKHINNQGTIKIAKLFLFAFVLGGFQFNKSYAVYPVMSVSVERGLRWCSLPTVITIDSSGSVIKEYCDKVNDKEVLKSVQIGSLTISAMNIVHYYADTLALAGQQADASAKSPCKDASYEYYQVYSFKSPIAVAGSIVTQELKTNLIAVTSCEQVLSSVNLYEAQKSIKFLNGILESFEAMTEYKNSTVESDKSPGDSVKFPIMILPIPK